MDGVSYQSDDWTLNQYGQPWFTNKSMYMSWYNETTYEDLPDDRKLAYNVSMELDALRFPLFNAPDSNIFSYLAGYESGAFSWIGEEVQVFGERTLYEIKNGR